MRPQEGEPRTRPLVLHVTETLNAGVRGVIEDYARANTALAHVVVGRERRGLPVESMSSYLEYRVSRSLVRWSLDVRQSIARLHPDVVHFHSSAAGLLSVVLRHPARAARVYTPHCFYFRRTDLTRRRRAVAYAAEKLIARRTGVCAAVGAWEYADAVRVGYGHRRTRLVPNGVAATSGGQPAVAGTSPSVVGVGRVGRQKGSSFFAAVAQLCGPQCDATFVWVGGGNVEDVERLEHSGVDVTGWVPRSEAMDHLARAAVYLHCSEWDSVPLTLLEAATADVPIVCRDSDALQHLGVEHLCGSPLEAARAVLRLLSGAAPLSRVPDRTLRLHSSEAFSSCSSGLYRELSGMVSVVAEAG